MTSEVLNPREVKILGLLEQGMSRNPMAVELQTSPNLILYYQRHICAKLQAPYPSEAVKRWVNEGRPKGTPVMWAASNENSPLSERLQQVLVLAFVGDSNDAIAEELGIEPGTVKLHLNNAIKKLKLATGTKAQDRLEAAELAFALGFVSTENVRLIKPEKLQKLVRLGAEYTGLEKLTPLLATWAAEVQAQQLPR